MGSRHGYTVEAFDGSSIAVERGVDPYIDVIVNIVKTRDQVGSATGFAIRGNRNEGRRRWKSDKMRGWAVTAHDTPMASNDSLNSCGSDNNGRGVSSTSCVTNPHTL